MIQKDVLIVGLADRDCRRPARRTPFSRGSTGGPCRDDKGVSIVIYDRWSGRFQRAVYEDNGSLNVMGVYTPF